VTQQKKPEQARWADFCFLSLESSLGLTFNSSLANARLSAPAAKDRMELQAKWKPRVHLASRSEQGHRALGLEEAWYWVSDLLHSSFWACHGSWRRRRGLSTESQMFSVTDGCRCKLSLKETFLHLGGHGGLPVPEDHWLSSEPWHPWGKSGPWSLVNQWSLESQEKGFLPARVDRVLPGDAPAVGSFSD
jgi:hypothetical protein